MNDLLNHPPKPRRFEGEKIPVKQKISSISVNKNIPIYNNIDYSQSTSRKFILNNWFQINTLLSLAIIILFASFSAIKKFNSDVHQFIFQEPNKSNFPFEAIIYDYSKKIILFISQQFHIDMNTISFFLLTFFFS